MRKLVILRGAQGVGKSRFVQQAGLHGNVLSTDSIRNILSSAVLGGHGRMLVNQDLNDRVFAMYRSLMNERMDRGETLVLDQTFMHHEEIRKCVEFATKHRYGVACVDFANFPIDLAITRDAARHEFERVGEAKIREVHGQILSHPPGVMDGIHVIPWAEDGSHLDALNGWLAEPIHDLSHYSGVMHVGDLQGCYTVLAGPGGPLEAGLRDDMAYIFVGDLLDRGIENGKVMRWFVENALARDNVFLMWGNHEDHLHHFSTGKADLADEFLNRTLPQLREAGITELDADAVCTKAIDFLHYNYRGTEVIVTHGGLSTAPARPELLSSRQCIHGTGYWEAPVDKSYEQNGSHGIYQVHGHRNFFRVPIRATHYSFNLEDEVEFGGNLRTATLDAKGWTTASYPNRVFRPRKEWIGIELNSKRARDLSKYPSWMMPEAKQAPIAIDEATMTSMRNHKGVVERASQSYPHVASFNFSKKVFYDKAWDDVVVKARGLFFDLESHEIVARGYEKFFNIGERPETSMASLKATLKFPVTVYVKENGFLGNIGYDRRTDTLFVASKSTPDGPFADMFRKIVDATLDPERKDVLRRYLRDTESSLTFEVIDPIGDPHMVEYDEPKMILLDILRRTTAFERANEKTLTEVSQRFGLQRKERLMQFKDWDSFAGWHRKASTSYGHTYNGSPVEGFVIEDANGYMTKTKGAWYSMWKRMRWAKDRIASCRIKNVPFSTDYNVRPDGTQSTDFERNLANDFIEWCRGQSLDNLALDIITLRKAFLRDVAITNEKSPADYAISR
jgi:predicted kinase